MPAKTQRRPSSAATAFVALLRGVNVGGKNMISMNSVKASFERMGFADVSSYINSGNILFRSGEKDPRRLERKIERALAREHSLNCKVVIRSFGELADLIKSLPRNWDADKAWKYNVIFLRHTIDAETVLDGLKPIADIETVVYRPGTLLWSARISDLSRTRMLKLSSQKIFQEMTVRNTNTVRKLYQLMKSMMEG